MEVRVLGPIEVHNPDLRPLGGPVQRRALAMLALKAGGTVSVDQLVDGIWPNGDTPARADHNVRTYVHRLRTAIGDDRIETVGSDYRLRVARDEFDVFRFEDLVDEARSAAGRGEPARAQELLGQATDLWRGDPYDDVADHDWARTEIARLGELRASAVEQLMQASLDAGRHTEIIGSLQEAVAAEPLRERRRAQLALALYRAGRQAEALRAVQDYRAELADEVGLEPSPDLDELEHRILEHDPGLLPASHRRHVLRGYELDEVIGEGAFSLVWRGIQPALNRTVAVKQIRAELANQPDFIRRFETEAQTVAALEHPFIVPLYDYWREPDSAYLVMRYVAGGTLEAELLAHRLDDTRLRRMIEQVGAALQTAHRSGVIHRDVKSANVLIDGDDNFYLSDFGIAFTGADDEIAASLSTGSPAYASPEQLRRQELDHRTDVYGFGITLFEAATGRLPFVDAPTQAAMVQRQLDDPVPAPSSVETSVPRWVDDVVARATAKNPSDRFATMAELMAAVPAVGGRSDGGLAGATVIGELVNPFKALRAFREADAADFHGRDRLVHRFLEVLSQPGTAGRMLAVVGPSGSGKSSAVRSGLVPRLRAGAVPGSDDWFITTMLPGGRPFEELESALSRVAVRQPGPLVEVMRGDERGIARAINQILPDEESELVLVIDQFEELFTHTADDERTRFLDGLLAAVREPRARLRVVVTVRADFWDRPLRHPGLAARLETAAVTVSPLAADELEAAIVEPVRRQGAVYEPGLVARIIADVGDQPGALPLLQYALTELFDRHVSGLIRTETYDEIGGLTGALASRAEATFESLTADQQAAARRLFGRLVSLVEGTEDTRRRVRVAELGGDPDMAAVVDAFGAARMLVFDVDPSTREPTVEIAHEALLRAWPRLRGWLDEDRDGIRIHRHLTDTAAAWLASDRDPGELYRGGRLETAETWAADHRADLNATERGFLDASTAAHEAEEAAEREHLEQQERSNRRLRALASIAAVIALIAATAGAFALQQRSRADDQAAEAESNAAEAERNAAEAESNAAEAERNAAEASDRAAEAQVERDRADREADEARRQAEAATSAEAAADLERLLALARTADPIDPTIGILLAVEAHRASPSPATLDALHRALTARRGFMGTLRTGELGQDITVVDGGEGLVVHTNETVQLWDVGERSLVRSWPAELPEGSGSAIDLRTSASDDGRIVAASTRAHTRAFDSETGDELFEVEHDDEIALAVAVSPDGASVAVGLSSGVIEVRDVATGDLRSALPGQAGEPVKDIEWHPDGSALGVITRSGVEVRGLESDEAIWGIGGLYEGLLFSSDGDRLVLSRVDETERFARSGGLLVVDPADGSNVRDPIVFSAEVGRVSSIGWWDDAETQVAGLGGTATVRVLDLASGEITHTLNPEVEEEGSGGGTDTGMAVLPALGLVATAGAGGVELRDMDDTGPLAQLAQLPPVLAANPARWLTPAFDDDGQTFVVSTLLDDVDPFVYDRREPLLLPEPAAGVLPDDPSFVFSSGRFTAHISATGTVTRSGLDGSPVGPAMATIPLDVPSLVALSPTGTRFLQADGRAVTLYDTTTGGIVARLEDELPTPPEIPDFDFWVMAFPTDGETFIVWSAAGRASALVDARNGDVIWSSTEMGRAYPLDGQRYLGGSDGSGGITLHDPRTREIVAETLVGHTALATQLFPNHANSNLAVSAGRDGTSRVWDLETGQQMGRELATEAFGNRSWSPDGTTLANPGSNGMELWNYDTDSWVDIACEVAGRNLTAAEWGSLGPRSLDYRATCPQYDLHE